MKNTVSRYECSEGQHGVTPRSSLLLLHSQCRRACGARPSDGRLRHSKWLARGAPPLDGALRRHGAHLGCPLRDGHVRAEQVVRAGTAHIVVALAAEHVVALVVLVNVLEVARVESP
eukprot:3730682-Pleurochrysis_carterae.AAC.2